MGSAGGEPITAAECRGVPGLDPTIEALPCGICTQKLFFFVACAFSCHQYRVVTERVCEGQRGSHQLKGQQTHALERSVVVVRSVCDM